MTKGEERKRKLITEDDRTIEFYHARQAAAGPAFEAFDVDKFVKELSEIPPADRWVTIRSNNERFDCWYTKGEKLHGFKIGITRTRARGGAVDLTTAELSGVEIPENKEYTEYSHLIIFPDNIVGFEYNPAGPRLSQLSEFIEQKWPDMGMIKFEPVASKDFEKNLRNIPRLSSITLTITPANAQLYAQIDKDFETLSAAQLGRSGAKKMKLVFYPEKNTDSIREFGLHWFTNIVKLPDPRESIKKMGLKFEGKNGTTLTSSGCITQH